MSGSLQLNITNLQSAFTGISTLLGDDNGGLTAGANLAGNVPGTDAGDLAGHLQNLLSMDPQELVNQLLGVVDQLREKLNFTSPAGLQDFLDRAEGLDQLFGASLIGDLRNVVAAVSSLADGIPANPAAAIQPIMAKVLELVRSLGGEEAIQIANWMESLQDQLTRFAPLITEAQTSPDPAALLLRVVGELLDELLEIFGFGQIAPALRFLEEAPNLLLDADLVTALGAAFDAAQSGFAAMQAAADGSTADLAVAVVAYENLSLRLQADMRPVLAAVQKVTQIELLRPGLLKRRLRELMRGILGVQVIENRKIDDPYKALLDRIDAAVDQIDLTQVRDLVLGFFETTQQTIDSVDLPNLGQLLDGQLSTMENGVTQLQQGVSQLLGQLEEFFDGLLQELRNILANIGSFQPDDSFHFNFEDSLRNLFNGAKTGLAGDPENPDTPSLKGSLQQMQQTIDGFLQQLTDLLQPVADATQGSVDTAVQGINGFVQFLKDQNIPAKLATLTDKLQEIVDQLDPISFDPVVDPIVAEIDENRDALAKVNTDDLNDLLKAALAAALDVIINIDFTVAVSDPLKDEFEVIRAVPRLAVDELQKGYELGLAELDKLSPTQLLDALLKAFDVIHKAVDSLKLENLLAPLDQLHDQYLIQPLNSLKPSTLLAPVGDAFDGLTSGLNQLDGAALLAPLVARLDQLKQVVADLDLNEPLDTILEQIERVKTTLQGLRPSDLLASLEETFAQAELELDRFKPSVVFEPVTQLATPLLGFLEMAQQDVITALNDVFQAPLRALERLNPEALVAEIHGVIDGLLALLRTVDPEVRFNQLKALHFDLNASVQAGGNAIKIGMVANIDPQRELAGFITTYQQLVAALEAAKENIALPDLDDMYNQLRDQLLAMLPPYGRALLDVETFKRVMRLADPTRFLTELDARFDTIKDKLIPLRPADLGAELDATWQVVLDKVQNLDLSEPLQRVKDTLDRVKGVVTGVRVDFIAADLDRALADLKAVVNAISPSALFADLDGLHAELVTVVGETKPSVLLAGLDGPLAQIRAILDNLDPGDKLGPPLEAAWKEITEILAAVDFAEVLAPLLIALDGLEVEFTDGLRRVETSFDGMLSAGRSALGSGSASASVSVGV